MSNGRIFMLDGSFDEDFAKKSAFWGGENSKKFWDQNSLKIQKKFSPLLGHQSFE
jgi:hypothetical protein